MKIAVPSLEVEAFKAWVNDTLASCLPEELQASLKHLTIQILQKSISCWGRDSALGVQVAFYDYAGDNVFRRILISRDRQNKTFDFGKLVEKIKELAPLYEERKKVRERREETRIAQEHRRTALRCRIENSGAKQIEERGGGIYIHGVEHWSPENQDALLCTLQQLCGTYSRG